MGVALNHRTSGGAFRGRRAPPRRVRGWPRNGHRL